LVAALVALGLDFGLSPELQPAPVATATAAPAATRRKPRRVKLSSIAA
jgi:hypothetical protein